MNHGSGCNLAILTTMEKEEKKIDDDSKIRRANISSNNQPAVGLTALQSVSPGMGALKFGMSTLMPKLRPYDLVP